MKTYGNAFAPEGGVSFDIENLPSITPVLTAKGVFKWRLNKPWMFFINPRQYIIIPVDKSATNFASVPPMLQGIINATDHVIALPAIVHDYLVGEFSNEVPTLYTISDDETTTSVIESPLYNNNWDWVASARLFKDLCHSFKGSRAYVKGHVCYFFLRLAGKFRGYK